jgi:hypothetical protein
MMMSSKSMLFSFGALVLAVGGGYAAYTYTPRSATVAVDSTSVASPKATGTPVAIPAEPTPVASQAPVTSINTEITDLDSQIAAIDTTDFSADGVSDQSLGL